MSGHGGARPGAGRPKGSRNRLPSKSAALAERLSTQVEPLFDEITQQLIDLALGRSNQTSRSPADTQLKAIEVLLDRLLGKPDQYLEVLASLEGETGDKATLQDIVDLWDDTEGSDNGRSEDPPS